MLDSQFNRQYSWLKIGLMAVILPFLFPALKAQESAQEKEAIAKVLKAWEGQPHQSDSDLILNFRAHQKEFLKLLSMIQADARITRIYEDWTSPSEMSSIQVSDGRVGEYRGLFKLLGLARGFSADPARKGIHLLSSCQGWVGRGSSKGYVYLKVPQKEVMPCLDSLTKDDGSDGTWFRHIEGSWYLEFDRH